MELTCKYGKQIGQLAPRYNHERDGLSPCKQHISLRVYLLHASLLCMTWQYGPFLGFRISNSELMGTFQPTIAVAALWNFGINRETCILETLDIVFCACWPSRSEGHTRCRCRKEVPNIILSSSTAIQIHQGKGS